MKCPNCGAIEQARVRVCQTCGATYASEDLLELRQLEFLLAETAAWPGAEARRKRYDERLAALKSRILPLSPTAAVPQPAAPLMEPEGEPPTVGDDWPRLADALYAATRPEPEVETTLAGPAAQPAALPPEPEVGQLPTGPAPGPIPFDQWLLSERNIKIALYSGGLLLVLAGLIFVGVNWARIPGPAKFAVTLMATSLMYLGGYLVFQRPLLRLGGVAMLGVAAGFVPLNFAVLQIYIFSARGLSANTMWFLGSLPTLLLYLLTAYWTRADLFTLLSLGAVMSVLTAGLMLLDAPLLVFVLAYVLLSLVFLLTAHAFEPTRLASFTRAPLLIVSHTAMPILLISSAVLWVRDTGCTICREGSPWLTLAAMFIGVIFYVITDIAFRWPAARWVAAYAFAVTFVFLLIELRFSGTATGITLMVLALAYLLVGNALQRRAGSSSAAWPLYAAGYTVAAFVTVQALLALGEHPDNLAKILMGDVILLALSAWVHRQYDWVYGATWLFIAPVYIYTGLYLPGAVNQGLVLSVLMLNYVAAGYTLGRRALRLGGPFLTAAAFLSVTVVILTWSNAVVASIVLLLIGMLYLFAALWLRRSWLLLPALAAANVAVVSILSIFFTVHSPWRYPLTVSYAGLGVALALGGARLRQAGYKAWGWPLYVAAAFDLAVPYLAGLFLGGPIAIGLSIVFAVLAFGLAWVERVTFANAKLPPLLSYLGAALIFVGHFYVIHLSSSAWAVWPAYSALLCALFMVSAWPLRAEPVGQVYGTPLRWSGICLMLVPAYAALDISEPLLIAVTFAIAGTAYAADAAVRRILNLGYLAGGLFLVVLWAILLYFDVSELQAYVMPLGVGLLALGWNERHLGHGTLYLWSTFLGLLVLMGSAFYQSHGAVIYAALLLIESLVALAWGAHIRSRGYMQIGVLALLMNAIAQLGPGFAELPRFIHLGLIGAILFGGGLVALLRREQLLAAHERLTVAWGRWES